MRKPHDSSDEQKTVLDQAINNYFATDLENHVLTDWVLVAGTIPTDPDNTETLVSVRFNNHQPFWRTTGLLTEALDARATDDD